MATIKLKKEYRLQKVPVINRPHLEGAKYMIQKWDEATGHYNNVQGLTNRLTAEVSLYKLTH